MMAIEKIYGRLGLRWVVEPVPREVWCLFLRGIGLPELLVILFIVLMLFGARRLPEVGAALGKTIREMRRYSQSVADDEPSRSSAEEPASGSRGVECKKGVEQQGDSGI